MSTSATYLVAASVAVAALLLLAPSPATADGGGWDDAHATFYGNETVQETMQGACGYGDLFKQGYGVETAALSSALFNDGWSCGACYELQCYGSDYCKPGGATVKLTATNFCPANYSKPSENWCNPPLKHFDLSMPMFLDLVSDFHVGIIPVRYRRVPCAKQGGVRFEMKGIQHIWAAVLVFNVGGSGDVKAMAVKGSQGGQWVDMSRNWGQIWNIDGRLVEQALSFRVTASDGRSIVFDDIVPPTWTVGQSFEGKGQF